MMRRRRAIQEGGMHERPGDDDRLEPRPAATDPPSLSPPVGWDPPAASVASQPTAVPEGPPLAPASDPPASAPPIDWTGNANLTTPPPGRRRFVYIGLGLAILVLLGLVGSILRGSGSDAYDIAANDFGRQLLAMPDFKAKYGELTSEQQAYEVGQKAAASGIPRLGDADLLHYWQDSAKLLNVAEPGACGRILRNTIQPGEASKLARALDIETFKDLLAVTLLAVQADLRGDPVRPVPDAQQVSDAFAKLQSAMGPAMIDSSAKLTDASATDADVCVAGRTFIGGVLALGEPDRTVILRYSISSATP
jgi:hypothetical protein